MTICVGTRKNPSLQPIQLLPVLVNNMIQFELEVYDSSSHKAAKMREVLQINDTIIELWVVEVAERIGDHWHSMQSLEDLRENGKIEFIFYQVAVHALR